MINQEKQYYLYRHIRRDKNQPFYIGIGTKRKSKSKNKDLLKSHKWIYDRAYSKIRKNSKIWNLIVSKTDYDIEILYESENICFIKEKEKEFINLYGRIDLKTGILANMTNGGDGINGYSRKFTEEQKIKHQNHSSCKKVVKINEKYEIIEQYKSSREASRINKINNIASICRNKHKCKNNITYRYLEDYNFFNNVVNDTYYSNNNYIIYDKKQWQVHDFCQFFAKINRQDYQLIYNRLKRGLPIEKAIKKNKMLKPSKYKYVLQDINNNEIIKSGNMEEICNYLNESRWTIFYRIKNKTIKNNQHIVKIKESYI